MIPFLPTMVAAASMMDILHLHFCGSAWVLREGLSCADLRKSRVYNLVTHANMLNICRTMGNGRHRKARICAPRRGKRRVRGHRTRRPPTGNGGAGSGMRRDRHMGQGTSAASRAGKASALALSILLAFGAPLDGLSAYAAEKAEPLAERSETAPSRLSAQVEGESKLDASTHSDPSSATAG